MPTPHHWQEPPCCATCKHLVYSSKYKGHACSALKHLIPDPHKPACQSFTPKKSNIKH